MTRAHDVSEYISWNVPRPPFYIQDLLPQGGSMLLYGAPGVKKSWLVQHMAYCISVGEPWLGFNTTQARVTLVNFEISAPSYHGRLVLMARNFTLTEQMLWELSPSIMYLEDRTVFEQLARDIRPTAPDVIILDCLSGCFGGDENSSREMSLFIRNVAELQQEHNASVIIVHHSNKNLLAVSAMDRARGHTKLTGWVDSVLYMVKQPSGVQLQFGKTRHSARELHNLNIRFNDYNWEIRRAANGNAANTEG